MAARSRGNGTNLDWLRKSCDISACDVSPDGNPEKYGRPMKSAIVWDSSQRLSIHVSIRPSTLSNMNNSETSWPIIIKFHLDHHWGGGLTALGFGLDRIRTLVSIATDSSHRVVMGKTL